MAAVAAALARSRHAVSCVRQGWNASAQDLFGISTTVTALHSSAHSTRQLTRIAVVGSGPAGFYFTDRILKLLGNDASVDIIDKLPTPFGLVRAGVAPDHPDTKNVINKFTSIAGDERVRFFGNVHVGRDISIQELRAVYQCVLLSYGASNDRKLGIPGEELPGVFSARQFVNWYNGHPDFVRLPVDLSKTQSVGIVGLGNVALDCARILLKPPEALERTDITDYALDELRRSAVQSVHIIGRRGPFQAQFSGKELREVLNLENSSVSMYPHDYQPTDLDLTEPRKNQKCANEMMKAHGRQPSSEPHRSLHLHFLSDPKALNPSPDAPDRLGSVTLEQTRLEASGDSQRAVGTGEHHDVPMQMLLKSVGYRAEALPGVPFDSRRSVVPNIVGRVVEAAGSEAVVPGLYVCGWLGRGPTGIIGTNLVDATVVAEGVAADVAQGALTGGTSANDLEAMLKERSVRYVTWADWLAIDAAETAAGAKRNRPRVKITDVEAMLQICKS